MRPAKSRAQEITVIGAGPTGLGAAWRLHELGHERWRLFESAPHPGGLAASIVDEKGFTWDLGGHVLFSHYEYFDRLMDELLGDAWVSHVRESWVWMRERFIPYPLQNNIRLLPKDELLACLEGLLEVQRQGQHDGPPRSFADWIQRSFGKGLADVFMTPYNKKVWAYDPSRLAANWMGERVATVDLARILRNLVHEKDDAGWGPNARFRFPLRGGTGAIWRALSARLPTDRLVLGRRLVEVHAKEKEAILDDGTRVKYDTLVSTLPLDLLVKAIADRPDLGKLATSFVHSSTHVVGVGIDGPIPDHLRTKCWLYFPEPEVPFYRATVFSNYSPNNVPKPGQQYSLMAEVSESPEKPVDHATVARACVDGLVKIGFLPLDRTVLSVWHRRLEHGYPTPWLGRDKILDPLDAELRALGIVSRGRFGAWKYEVSNQDHSLMQGVEAVDNVLLGAEETTYRYPSVVNAAKGTGRRPIG